MQPHACHLLKLKLSTLGTLCCVLALPLLASHAFAEGGPIDDEGSLVLDGQVVVPASDVMEGTENGAGRKFDLWSDTPPLWNPANTGPRPFIEWYPVPHEAPCIVIFPGGGYNILVPHEGVDYARRWNVEGYHAAVVHYRTQWFMDPQPLGKGPLMDAVRAMQFLREAAGDLQIDASRMAAIGSSAGGHVAAMLAVHGDSMRGEEGLSATEAVPNALLLCYPVIVRTPERPPVILVGETPEPNEVLFFSAERHVSASTPPTFIWHTVDDWLPVEHALAFAQALRRAERPFALHLFAEGGHGLGLATGEPGVELWPELAVQWLAGLWRPKAE